MSKERWEDMKFDNGSMGKIISAILAVLVAGAIAFNFRNDINQDHKIDTNYKEIEVLRTSYESHIEATGKIEKINEKNIDARFENIEKNMKELNVGVDKMSKNQLLIMRALNIKPVK